MANSLQGKVAIVTGGNSGIGKAIALLFAAEGASTIVSARRVEEGEETVNEILKSGGVAAFVQADVSKSTDVKALIDKSVSLYGKIDCLFNNAGISGNPGTPVTELDEAEWDQVINVNLKGVWLGMKYVIPVMKKNGVGSIVNMSSIYGLLGSHSGCNYIGHLWQKVATRIADRFREHLPLPQSGHLAANLGSVISGNQQSGTPTVAEVESVIESDSVTDNSRRKPMTFVGIHAPILSISAI